MEFTPRGEHRAAQPAPTAHVPAPTRRKHIDWATRTVRLELFIVLVGSALLIAAVALYLAFSGTTPGNSESSRINKDKYQAVFLTGVASNGSVATYFGHITKMTDNYIVMNDVYYLTSSSSDQNQNANPQLIKLGCQQLHSPYDEIIINRSQAAFWENIRDDGKVVTAIKQFKKENPKGPDCSTATQSSSQSSTTPQSSTPTTTPTTNNKQP